MLLWKETLIQEGLFLYFISNPHFRWGLGPMAKTKKQLVTDGKLDKYGRPNDKTPQRWKEHYQYMTGEGFAIVTYLP